MSNIEIRQGFVGVTIVIILKVWRLIRYIDRNSSNVINQFREGISGGENQPIGKPTFGANLKRMISRVGFILIIGNQICELWKGSQELCNGDGRPAKY